MHLVPAGVAPQALHLHTRCIVQRFIAHHAVLYKIYVVGKGVHVVLRPSVCAPRVEDGVCEFDSHYLKTDAKPISGPAETEAWARFEPVRERVLAFTRYLARELSLSLFGWDLIISEQDTTPYIIDVNTFPGYDGVPNVYEEITNLLRH